MVVDLEDNFHVSTVAFILEVVWDIIRVHINFHYELIFILVLVVPDHNFWLVVSQVVTFSLFLLVDVALVIALDRKNLAFFVMDYKLWCMNRMLLSPSHVHIQFEKEMIERDCIPNLFFVAFFLIAYHVKIKGPARR